MKKVVPYYFIALGIANIWLAWFFVYLADDMACEFRRLLGGMPLPRVTCVFLDVPWWPLVFVGVSTIAAVFSFAFRSHCQQLLHVATILVSAEAVILCAALAGFTLPYARFTSLVPYMRASVDYDVLSSPDRIELVYSNPIGREVLESPAEVRQFAITSPLEPKEPCKCAHGQNIIYFRGRKRLEVSICNHCFDVEPAGRSNLFHMPQYIYERFAEHRNVFVSKLEATEPQRRLEPSSAGAPEGRSR